MSNLFIIDNNRNRKVIDYLKLWLTGAVVVDIATGYFEIGALLDLDGDWQHLDKIRLLMGDEVSRRTHQAFTESLTEIKDRLDDSIETVKEKDDFLTGVPAIVEAIKSGQIEAKVYRKSKFHAKTIIAHGKMGNINSSAMVGSSNFTRPGLSQNVELNVNLQSVQQVAELQAWFEQYWQAAEDVTPDILRTIERHTRAYSPFEIYARSMAAYFHNPAMQASDWEKLESIIYPILSNYQREGYHNLIQIAKKHQGALLCDGVGLGKTYIGLMLIERLLFDRQKVALFAPKAVKEGVWEKRLAEYLPRTLNSNWGGLALHSHTDLLRGRSYPQKMANIAEEADVIIIDEAHHFRNLPSNRTRKMYELTAGKKLFLLTATPINNSLYDLMHLIELFARRDNPAHFSNIGIHSLRGHFRKMEKTLEEMTDGAVVGQTILDASTAELVLENDPLFQALVVQRSRAYVRQSLQQEESGNNEVTFPRRQDPQVANYAIRQTYGRLLDSLERAFSKQKPILSLPIYNPINYLLEDEDEETVDPFDKGRQTQVVALIRTLLLKRFESSAKSFESSCENLLLKLLYFTRLHAPKQAARWENQHAELVERVKAHLIDRGLWSGGTWDEDNADNEDELDEDFIPAEFKKKIEKLDEKKYNVAEMVMEVIMDMAQLAEFLEELREFDPAKDDKLQVLINLLQNDPILKQNKVLIFTEFVETAHYLAEQLEQAGIGPLDQIDSKTQRKQSDIIQAFSPYYNQSSPLISHPLSTTSISPPLGGIKGGASSAETRVLIATDVLAEGLNLQDATCIINYDLHWNPVRLMQRIGRVDRRLDPTIEQQIIQDQPHLAEVRGTVHLWNFLPPKALNRILSLYQKVSNKTLRISKTFGIEGKKLLTPDDDYDALREFNSAYEGTTTTMEHMKLAYDQLVKEHPELMAGTDYMPYRIFSGKQYLQGSGVRGQESLSEQARAVFFCYRLPAKDERGDWSGTEDVTQWYLYDFASDTIMDEATQIFAYIQCQPETPRQTLTPKPALIDLRVKLDKHIKNSYLRRVQAPVGTKAKLLAWMELI